MKTSHFKKHLSGQESLNFVLENNIQIPPHFHVTEAGITTKQFVDCGNTIRTEKKLNFQIWLAEDTEHRLSPNKLLKIIEKTEQLWGNEDLDIEIEYQTNTIGKYTLDKKDNDFVLLATSTACLAQENCGIEQKTTKPKLNLAEISNKNVCCSPNTNSGKCC